MNNLTLSRNGRILIERREGERLTVYRDSAGFLTVGVGHKLPASTTLKLGDTITQAQCDTWLEQDLAYACHDVNDLVNVHLTQDQFDALVSFVFNIGDHDFATSTLLALLNKGDFTGAQKQFLLWDHTHITDPETGKTVKVVDKGLLNRRLAEAAQFGTVQAAPAPVPQLSVASPQPAAPVPSRPVPPPTSALQTSLGKWHATAMSIGAAALASGVVLHDLHAAFALGIGALGSCVVAFMRHHRSL